MINPQNRRPAIGSKVIIRVNGSKGQPYAGLTGIITRQLKAPGMENYSVIKLDQPFQVNRKKQITELKCHYAGFDVI
jgi:hypothetical protein